MIETESITHIKRTESAINSSNHLCIAKQKDDKIDEKQ